MSSKQNKISKSKSASKSVETKALPASGVASPETWFVDLLMGPQSNAGVSVGPGTAVRVPAVLACTRLIGTSIAGLPVKVLARNEDGSKQPDRAHPAYRLVHRRSNAWTSAGELRRQLTFDALLFGYGAALARRDLEGRVFEFLRVDPSRTPVTVESHPLTGEPIYVINGEPFHWQDVLFVGNPAGGAVISLVREAIGAAIVMEAHANKLFAGGARPSGILSAEDRPLDDKAKKNIRDAWAAFSQNGGTAILDRAMKYVPLTLTSVDAEFTQTRQFTITEIARAFGVPPTFLGILDQATYRNAEEMNLQFIRFCLDPWIKAWEAAYERILLTEDELDTINIEFNVDGLLRADSASRAEFYAKLRAAGAMTANEVRALENLPARADGDQLGNPYTTSGAPTPATIPEETTDAP